MIRYSIKKKQNAILPTDSRCEKINVEVRRGGTFYIWCERANQSLEAICVSRQSCSETTNVDFSLAVCFPAYVFSLDTFNRWRIIYKNTGFFLTIHWNSSNDMVQNVAFRNGHCDWTNCKYFSWTAAAITLECCMLSTVPTGCCECCFGFSFKFLFLSLFRYVLSFTYF